MTQVARHARMVAREGEGERAVELLLAAAESLKRDPGCELYLVSRQRDAESVIWVTELWRSQADLEAAAAKARESDEAKAVMEAVSDFEVTELELLGGKGARVGRDDGDSHAVVNVDEVDDMAPKFGLSDFHEARFLYEALRAEQSGVAHFRLKPGRRQPFAHRHHRAEEVYVVLAGSGRAKLDDEIVELKRLDTVRVAPGVARQFEAGPDGLELLAFSPRHEGDAEVVEEFWTD